MRNTVCNLKAENPKLVTAVGQQKKIIETLSRERDRSENECDVWKRATGSFKQENTPLQQTHKMIQHKFALNSKPAEYWSVSDRTLC